MKKLPKLVLRKETLRALDVNLARVLGGVQPKADYNSDPKVCPAPLANAK